MDILARGPMRATAFLWQAESGAFVFTLVCKATYVLVPGVSPLAAQQDECSVRDEHWNGDARQSLLVASDLVPFKRNADVVLTGHAYAPGQQPVPWLRARLIVGELDKTLAVFGDRCFSLDGQLRGPALFTKAPLRWECAGGGPGTANPVGLRSDGPTDLRGQLPVPSLQRPDTHVASRHDFIPAIGFGPVAPAWPDRVTKLYHHAAHWPFHRWMDQALPADIDPAFFNVAPPDQQVSELRPDERLVLENLHPEHPRLLTNLEGLRPRAILEVIGLPPAELRLRCDTLTIDTDRGTASLVWRTCVPMSVEAVTGTVTVTMVHDGAGVPSLPSIPPSASEHTLTGMFAAPTVQRPVLPFVSPGTQAASLVSLERASSVPVSSPGIVDELTVDAPVVHHLPAALPFNPTTEAPPEAAFTRAAIYCPQPPPEVPHAPASLFQLGAQAMGFRPTLTDDPKAPPVEPPALIGPLGHLRIAEPVPAADSPPVPAPVDLPAAIEEPNEVEPRLPLGVFPLERCARISASIARRPNDKSPILTKEEADPEEWPKLEDHWKDVVAAETKAGRPMMGIAYDEAYLAQIEEERGPITLHEYVRLMVAGEGGTEAEVLEELGIPRGAVGRLHRQWLRKQMQDGDLGRKLRAARAEQGG